MTTATATKCPLSPAEIREVLAVQKETKILCVRDADAKFDGFQNPAAHQIGVEFHPMRHNPQSDRYTPDTNLKHKRFIERAFVGSDRWPEGILIGGFEVESRAVKDSNKWEFINRHYDFPLGALEKLQSLSRGNRWVDSDEARTIELSRERKRRDAAEAALDPQAAIAAAVAQATAGVGDAIAKALATANAPKPAPAEKAK